VVIGIPGSWDPSITSISTENSRYLSSIWSPCSQFVAAVTRDALEIRDASTLKLLSTIQSTKVATRFRSGLAYSPDGHSLASCSDIGIVIWDTQTGGVVKTIMCDTHNGLRHVIDLIHDGLGLVWTSDGMMIGSIPPLESKTITVHTYGVASGAIQSSSTLQSINPRYFWAHNESFRVMTMVHDFQGGWMINIFEVGSVLTKVEQFPIPHHFSPDTFSPTTYRISAWNGSKHTGYVLFILDVCSSEVLLREPGSYKQHTFSPDGASFAAFTEDSLLIWRYISGHYTQWRKFQQNSTTPQFQQTSTTLQFSPASSSILGHANTLLHISHFDSPASPAMGSVVETNSLLQDVFPPNGTYIVTTHQGGSTVTITNLDSQCPSPSQLIDTNFEVLAMTLTGNVLLVKGEDTVVAWLLTEKGVVDGTFGNTRAGHKDSLWVIIPHEPILLEQAPWRNEPDNLLELSVQGDIAVIKLNGRINHVYHTRTGEILKWDKVPQPFSHRFKYLFQDEGKFDHHNLVVHHGPRGYRQPAVQTTLQGGWVKDPEGKHWLWLHM
jgi:hypothetical protein